MRTMINAPGLFTYICFQLIIRLVERIIHVSFLSQVVFSFLDHSLLPFSRFEIDDIAENHFRERSKREIYHDIIILS